MLQGVSMNNPDLRDECPKCHQFAMPKWSKDETAIARFCQNCGYKEAFEKEKKDETCHGYQMY